MDHNNAANASHGDAGLAGTSARALQVRWGLYLVARIALCRAPTAVPRTLDGAHPSDLRKHFVDLALWGTAPADCCACKKGSIAHLGQCEKSSLLPSIGSSETPNWKGSGMSTLHSLTWWSQRWPLQHLA